MNYYVVYDAQSGEIINNIMTSTEYSIDDVSLQDVKLDYLVTPTEVLSFGFTSISTK